jgi:hypothetical protein
MTIASVTYGITTARDVDKAAALQQAVVSKTTAIHRFVRDSKNYPGRPPISVNPGSRAIFTQPPEIIVHDIKDRAEQDKVIAAVQAVMREQKLTRVDFFSSWIKKLGLSRTIPMQALARLQAKAKGVQSYNSGECVYRKDMSKKTPARKR